MTDQKPSRFSDSLTLQAIGLLAVLGAFVVLFYHFWWNGYMEFDSYTNSTVGFQITEGKSLYRTVWGSKPPGIYFLDAIFISVFGVSHTAISIAQLSSGLFLLTSVYLLSFRLSKNILMSVTASLMLMAGLYFSVLYQGGNLTEEYGIAWLMLGWLFFALFDRSGEKAYLLVSGFAFCMSLWFKEPFVFSIIPITIYVIIRSYQDKSMGPVLRFFLGAMVPNLAFMLYFISSNTWFDYIKYLYYTTSYSGFTELSVIDKWGKAMTNIWHYVGDHYTWWPLIIMIVVIGFVLGQKKTRIWIGLFFFTLLLEIHATSMSGYSFQHYFIQLLPSFYLLVLLGFVGLKEGLAKHIGHVYSSWLATVPLVLLCVLNGYAVYGKFVSPTKEISRELDTQAFKLLATERTDSTTLYIDDPQYSHYYVASNIPSTAFMPVGVYHFYVVEDRYSHERIERHVASLHYNPPTFIITTGRSGILDKHEKLVGWFEENYQMANEEYIQDEIIRLWKRKDLQPLSF